MRRLVPPRPSVIEKLTEAANQAMLSVAAANDPTPLEVVSAYFSMAGAALQIAQSEGIPLQILQNAVMRLSLLIPPPGIPS